MICGYLESNGIHAEYDKGGVDAFLPYATGPYSGRQEIVVRAEDLDEAERLLKELPR
jgi:hypothetical protein